MKEMNKKQVLIISAVFPPEQVTSAYLNYDLAKKLSGEYNVIVLRPRPSRPIGTNFDEIEWVDPDFKTILIESHVNPKSQLIGRFREAIDFSRKCNKYISDHHNEISFVYNDGWQLFGLYLIAKKCVKYKIPYIVPIQDIYPESLLSNRSFPSVIKKWISNSLMCFDRYYQCHAVKIRTISNEMADYLSATRRINREKYLVINNWQNDDDFINLPKGQIKNKTTYAYVGSINEHANVDLIIKAFAQSNVKDSELQIYGGGNKKEYCENLVKQIGCSNIHFGYVSRQEIPKIQSNADVLILALPKGNGRLCLPSKLTSYMLSGKPIIASVDLDSTTACIIRNNECGIISESDNLDALSKAIANFINLSSSHKEAMSKNSRKYAIENLTRDINLNILVKEIKNTIS